MKNAEQETFDTLMKFTKDKEIIQTDHGRAIDVEIKSAEQLLELTGALAELSFDADRFNKPFPSAFNIQDYIDWRGDYGIKGHRTATTSPYGVYALPLRPEIERKGDDKPISISSVVGNLKKDMQEVGKIIVRDDTGKPTGGELQFPLTIELEAPIVAVVEKGREGKSLDVIRAEMDAESEAKKAAVKAANTPRESVGSWLHRVLNTPLFAGASKER